MVAVMAEAGKSKICRAGQQAGIQEGFLCCSLKAEFPLHWETSVFAPMVFN